MRLLPDFEDKDFTLVVGKTAGTQAEPVVKVSVNNIKTIRMTFNRAFMEAWPAPDGPIIVESAMREGRCYLRLRPCGPRGKDAARVGSSAGSVALTRVGPKTGGSMGMSVKSHPFEPGVTHLATDCAFERDDDVVIVQMPNWPEMLREVEADEGDDD